MKKIMKNRSPGVGKLRKMGARGAFQMQQNAKLKKIGDPLNSFAPFLAILVENGSQDGGQNPPQIDKKSIQKLMFFLTGFWMHFGKDLGAKMEEKSMQKRCQKHVGIDLEVQVAKTQKLTPLIAFLVFFQVKLGPKSIKNRRKIDPKSSKFFDQVFGSIFCRLFMDLATILGAGMEPKSI